MPDIFPPNKKKKKNDSNSKSNTAIPKPNKPKPSKPKTKFTKSSFSSPSKPKPSFPRGSNNHFNTKQNKPKLTPDEKIEVIKKIYKEALHREPSKKDINYYKYSPLDEKSILQKLIKSEEHKNLIEQGQKYKKLKAEADSNKLLVKKLKGQIKDQVEEMRKLAQLLKEKNRHIEELRRQNNNPYNLVRHKSNKQS